jgi:hypothetical protein
VLLLEEFVLPDKPSSAGICLGYCRFARARMLNSRPVEEEEFDD